MTPTELDAHLRAASAVKSDEIAKSSLASQEQDMNEEVVFVRGFLDALRATKPGLSMKQKRNMVLKREEKRERKRKINRLSAQRKRIRERELMDTLSKQFKQQGSANEDLKKESEQL